ncbi:MAG: glycosyltransferase family 4 protein [Anaerolineales bacterium]|nr:glycosyltransferase family 4 protein [Anaerolineales bacterium]
MKRLLRFFKKLFPGFSRFVFRLRDAALSLPIRLQILRLVKSDAHPSIAYLTLNFPKPPALRSEFTHGGSVKLTYLAESFPHHFPSASLLYAVSSVGHPLRASILDLAKRRGLKVIVNQNGVSFPAWDGENYTESNRDMKTVISFADFIIYQSRFCKTSAERYISPPDVPSEIIYNPVDIRLFTPDACSKKPDELTLLLGGNQYEKYRLELALQTLKALHRDVPNAKLIVTGNLWLPHDEAEEWTAIAIKELKLADHVTFTGTYTQSEAPALYSKAHLLLHTKYADPSPGLVLEALALGLPVVHLTNGGVPELVAEAGIGVHVGHDWNRITLPAPQAMADAVIQVYARRDEYSQLARQRAVELFSLEKFVARHKEIFEKVLSS